MEVSRPAITRLARRAGVKSISDDCFAVIRAVMVQRLEEVLRKAVIINEEHQTKTLMKEDVYEALSLSGENLTRSDFLGTSTIPGRQ
jgi:histone H3/H4